MSGRSFLCDLWFSQTLRHKNYIYTYIHVQYTLIGWQAYRGDQIHHKNSPTELQNQIQVKYKNTCRAYSTFKTRLKADFGQIWILEKQVPVLLETSNFV